MSYSVQNNDLDRAIRALHRSRAATPEFYRQLSQGELWLLMPYHPEIEGEILQLKNGAPFPFVRLQDSEGEVVPIFSSEARADEAVKKSGTPPRTFSVGNLPARQALEILGAMKFRAVINKNCPTGEVTIPYELCRDLANGEALKPLGIGPSERKTIKIVQPEDYPTTFLQSLFEFLRNHQSFRAAWIFTSNETSASAAANSAPHYYLMILMDPRDDVLFHDFNMVVQAARMDANHGKELEVEIKLAHEGKPEELAIYFQKAQPFYVAADYKPPPPIAT